MASLAARLFPMVSGLLRGRGAESGSIVLDRRRIYILPTRQGMVFAFSLLAMLIGSINYGLSLGYVLTFMLGGVAVVCILHTYKNLRGLIITDADALPAFAGEDAMFQLGFEAPSPRFALSVRWRNAAPALLDVETVQRVNVQVPTAQRGRLRPGRFTLSTVYPLGLFRAWAYVEFDHATVVYPKPSEHRAEFSSAGKSGSAVQASTREGSDDFAGLRSWQPGDSPRHVAWRIAARSEVLATKRFSDTEGGTIMLDWDSLPGLDTEVRLSQLVRMVLDAEQTGLFYGLRIPGMEIAPASGMLHRQHCLEALALYGLPEHG